MMVLRAFRFVGGLLLVTGLTSLVHQFRNDGAPLPLPFIGRLDPGISLYWGAAAAGLGLALTFAGWRAAVRHRQSQDFWGAATGRDLEKHAEEESLTSETETRIRWLRLVPFMIGGFLFGSVLYIEQAWAQTDSPYRFMAIGAVLLLALAGLLLRTLYRGVKDLVRGWRRRGRRWAASVRGTGAGRGRRAVLSRQETEVVLEPSSNTAGDVLLEEEAETLFDPDRAKLLAAIENVLAHEQGYRLSAAATADDERPA